MKGILGRKLGNTQIFDESGQLIPVTVIEAGPCYVTQTKSLETDGYSAVQLGFEETSPKKLTKPELTRLKKVDLPALKVLREIRMKDTSQFPLGSKVTVSVFAAGEKVDVIGTSKGRGNAGVVKRHGFHGGPITHGQSDRQRHSGAVGAGTTPGRVYPGTRMAGHMGNAQVTSSGLKVVQVDEARNLLLVSGAVPGPRDGLVVVRESRKS
jgi:large subunit ribosomal protein L3